MRCDVKQSEMEEEKMKSLTRILIDVFFLFRGCNFIELISLFLKDRQKLVDSFQKGEIDVLICSFGVGSTGITLTRSHTVVLLDRLVKIIYGWRGVCYMCPCCSIGRPWTPGDVMQAEVSTPKNYFSDLFFFSFIDFLVSNY